MKGEVQVEVAACWHNDTNGNELTNYNRLIPYDSESATAEAHNRTDHLEHN